MRENERDRERAQEREKGDKGGYRDIIDKNM